MLVTVAPTQPMSKSPEVQEWKDFDGDPESPLQERRFLKDGMECVNPEHVVLRDKKTGEPLIAINPDDQRISWDPRVIDSEAMKSFMRKALIKMDREDRQKNQGFGY